MFLSKEDLKIIATPSPKGQNKKNLNLSRQISFEATLLPKPHFSNFSFAEIENVCLKPLTQNSSKIASEKFDRHQSQELEVGNKCQRFDRRSSFFSDDKIPFFDESFA